MLGGENTIPQGEHAFMNAGGNEASSGLLLHVIIIGLEGLDVCSGGAGFRGRPRWGGDRAAANAPPTSAWGEGGQGAHFEEELARSRTAALVAAVVLSTDKPPAPMSCAIRIKRASCVMCWAEKDDV